MKKDTAEALLTLSKNEYDEFAKEFSDSRQYFWRELEFLKNYVQPNGAVLDIGCGNGRLVDLFEGTNLHYTGVDFSTELITIAQKTRGDKGTFRDASALSLPFADNTFDTVFSIAVLHHIPGKQNRQQFVSETFRVLKPNGTCVLTTWNTLQWKFAKPHLMHSFKKICGFSDLDFGDMLIPFGKQKRQRYVHSLTPIGLRSLFKNSNFSDISTQEIKRQSGYANFVVIARKR